MTLRLDHSAPGTFQKISILSKLVAIHSLLAATINQLSSVDKRLNTEEITNTLIHLSELLDTLLNTDVN